MDVVVFVDIETDRLEPDRANPIQIALAAVNRETLGEIEVLEVKLALRANPDPEALERNCYDEAIWATEAVSHRSARAAVARFLDWHATWTRVSFGSGKEATWTELAGHNISWYDGPILKRWLGYYESLRKPAIWTTSTIDTMYWARAREFVLNERWVEGFSLGALCKKFDIIFEGEEHDALVDVRMTVELAKMLKKFSSFDDEGQA